MPAYIVVTREGPIRDQAEMDIYSRMNRESPPFAGIKPLVIYGNVETLEGEGPDGVVMLQFATMDDARAWYNSPTYQAALAHRKKAATFRSFIVEGI